MHTDVFQFTCLIHTLVILLTMAVKGTPNFVWFTDQPLGVGATGNVFVGRHKRRGELCAVKVFRSEGHSKEQVMREREFEVMKRLNHKNVVKFIAIEAETHGRERVLVMELCDGGSVYKMLEDPANAYGFVEDEFLLFLGDTTCALRYLRQNGIVHRDIKPGNILRTTSDDLRSVYKLTDFGAARELQDEDQFTSLYGTEEYLHPNMYSRALLGMPGHTQFDASVDLWSLGVTIFHVATGRLPFQPFGGRKNKEEMHRIISQKKSGYISGIQYTDGGEVVWSKDLPKTCMLSRGLQKLLLPILVGLLEVNPARKWSFNTFFKASDDITSKRVLHVFAVHTCTLDRLYLSDEIVKNIEHVQEAVAELTDVHAARQLLVLHGRHISVSDLVRHGSRADRDLSVRSHLDTRPEAPLIVVPESGPVEEWKVAGFEMPPQPTPPSSGSSSEDANFARNACGLAMYAARCVQLMTLVQTLLEDCLKLLDDQQSIEIQQQQQAIHLQQDCRQNNTKLVQKCIDMTHKYLELRTAAFMSSTQYGDDNYWMTLLAKLEQRRAEIETLSSDDYSGRQSIPKLSARSCQSQQNGCQRRLKKFTKEMRKICDDFRQQKHRELSYNEQQIHKFDRARLCDVLQKTVQLYHEHCLVTTRHANQQAMLWIRKSYSEEKQKMANRYTNMQQIQTALTDLQRMASDLEYRRTTELMLCIKEHSTTTNLVEVSATQPSGVRDEGRTGQRPVGKPTPIRHNQPSAAEHTEDSALGHSAPVSEQDSNYVIMLQTNRPNYMTSSKSVNHSALPISSTPSWKEHTVLTDNVNRGYELISRTGQPTPTAFSDITQEPDPVPNTTQLLNTPTDSLAPNVTNRYEIRNKFQELLQLQRASLEDLSRTSQVMSNQQCILSRALHSADFTVASSF